MSTANIVSIRDTAASSPAMPVYIPSSGRYNIWNGTLSRLPIGGGMYLVVQDQQAKWYEPMAEARGIEMLVLPKHIDRIAPTRKWIAEHAAAGGYAKHCQLDDDLYFYQRFGGATKMRNATEDEVHDMLMAIAFDLDVYAHVGVSDRNGNNREPNPWRLNTRYMRVLAYRTAEYLRCRHERVEVMEDFDIALQLLKAGFPSKVHYWWATGQGKTNARGGCSKWRTLDVHNAGAQKLAELHPNLVKVRQKDDAGDFGKRLEVTVQWRKAYREVLPQAA